MLTILLSALAGFNAAVIIWNVVDGDWPRVALGVAGTVCPLSLAIMRVRTGHA